MSKVILNFVYSQFSCLFTFKFLYIGFKTVEESYFLLFWQYGYVVESEQQEPLSWLYQSNNAIV